MLSRDPTLPTNEVAQATSPLRLGPFNQDGHLLLYNDSSTQRISAARIRDDRSVSPLGGLLCTTNSLRTIRTAHVGATDLVALAAQGEVPPSCLPTETTRKTLLVIQNAPRAPGQMNNAGFTALLVDPESGVITSRLDIPLDVPLLDSPAAPEIITSSDKKQALLGFFAQPLGFGGRDYVARIDCVGP